jgi:hypothetical protein
LSSRFSAITARTPPGPQRFAAMRVRCRTRTGHLSFARQRRACVQRCATLRNAEFGARISNSRPTGCRASSRPYQELQEIVFAEGSCGPSRGDVDPRRSPLRILP